MNLIKANDTCKSAILSSLTSIKYFQELIKEWNDPQDIAVRAAIMLKKTHQTYGKIISEILENIITDCEHPKNMRDNCNGIVYCMNCNFDLEK